jgi:hypothetical protein
MKDFGRFIKRQERFYVFYVSYVFYLLYLFYVFYAYNIPYIYAWYIYSYSPQSRVMYPTYPKNQIWKRQENTNRERQW